MLHTSFTSLTKNYQATAAQLLADFGDGEEHEAVITGSKLGMTVENVLERTVVHDVEPNGPAVRLALLALMFCLGRLRLRERECVCVRKRTRVKKKEVAKLHFSSL